ncbi:MAG TPA: glycogen synthase GlgA [Terrisporobacter glycolicus]|uniref:glycogen synthase GlgA n=1 Tax=Terrisporobacter TaxID=1505652 RepID=UPI000E88C0B7|nr:MULTISPECIES: glycogen synthase GlgA [Terrisporobacter]HBI91058.1 glycogen synthase GlgA [Terrisporobacter hibernicus]
MKILYVTAECWPFVKTGGLGDVSYALPKALKKEGADVRVIMPKYSTIPTYLKDKFKPIAEFSVKVGWRNQYCGIETMELEGVTFYFIDNEFYFKRSDEPSIYGHGDDPERFAFFSNAVLSSMEKLNFYPDVMNLNDWHTGMIPLLLKEDYGHLKKYKNIKTVYTIHNLQYQGIFNKDMIRNVFDISYDYFNNGDIEFYGKVNFMKAGIVFAHKVTTVSKTYVEEIQTPFYGEGLDGLLKSKSYKLEGILNGIDYDLNNPATDKAIFEKFDVSCIHKKLQNKIKLQEILGLEVNHNIPLVGIVSRLTSQKGLDLINYMMPEIMRENLQMVVLGTGEHQYQSMFNYYNSNFSNKLSARITFDSAFAQQIYAACDIFLMPSLYEPCGIGQMLAMRYGSIPIVRETGGLKDTVTPYNQYTGEGNGFSFTNYNAHEMFFTLQKAITLYQDKSIWNNLIINAMNTGNSWKKSAQDYMRIFNGLIS